MLENIVREEMVKALKNKENAKKTILSLLVQKLSLAAKEKKAPLTEDEEGQIVLKMCKQIQETLDSCPPFRLDIKNQACYELAVLSAYAPTQMSTDEVKSVIQDVLTELDIEKPTPRDKGKIMKILMPRVKGKADGNLVNDILAEMMKL